MRNILLTAMISLAVQSGAAFAQDAKPEVGQVFGDWVFRCSAKAKDTTNCALVQTIVAEADKHKIAQLQLVEAKEGAAPQFTLLLPLGLDAQRPITLSIDGAEALPASVKTCLPQGCVASLDLDSTIADALAAGSSLSVVFSMANGKQDIGFNGSLKGLSDAFAAVAWF